MTFLFFLFFFSFLLFKMAYSRKTSKSSRPTKASCKGKQQWMSSYTRADGVKVKGHCHSPRKASRKVSRSASRKVSRKASRSASRKVSRKASRSASRKVSRKASRSVSRKASRSASRKGSRGKKSLPPQLKQMSSIVKSLAKSGNYSGNIMKAAAKIYRSSRK
jgi:colicin import membrane protein